MKYWFKIKRSLPESEARKLWDKLAPFGANLTVLFDRVYIYGDAEEYIIQRISVVLVNTGYPVERG